MRFLALMALIIGYGSWTANSAAQNQEIIQLQGVVGPNQITDVSHITEDHFNNPILPPQNYQKPLTWSDWITTSTVHGIYNGYSMWPNFNRTGSYYFAYISMDGHLALYRYPNQFQGILPYSQFNGLNFINEPRWLPEPWLSTEFVYHQGMSVWVQDLNGFNFRKQIVDLTDHPDLQGMTLNSTGGETTVDDNGRYYPIYAWRYDSEAGVVSDHTVGIVDLQDRFLNPFLIKQHVGAIDISPDGNWILTLPAPGVEDTRKRLYSMNDLRLGIHRVTYLDSFNSGNGVYSIGHRGWALNELGNQVLVYQDNRDDWLKAFDFYVLKSYKIAHMANDLQMWDNGSTVIGQHLARMSRSENKGWAMMSTYSNDPDHPAWSANKIFFIRIRPYDGFPKILMVGSTQNVWPNLQFSDPYFTEAFANVTMDERRIIWGGNNFNQDNVEMMEYILPEDWADTEIKPGLRPPETSVREYMLYQ